LTNRRFSDTIGVEKLVNKFSALSAFRIALREVLVLFSNLIPLYYIINFSKKQAVFFGISGNSRFSEVR